MDWKEMGFLLEPRSSINTTLGDFIKACRDAGYDDSSLLEITADGEPVYISVYKKKED